LEVRFGCACVNGQPVRPCFGFVLGEHVAAYNGGKLALAIFHERAVIRGGAPISSEDGLCTGEPVLAMAHHPSKDLIAVATTYALSIFEGVAVPPP
jgi:hypothetical protein